jgi:hypothetical protein
MSAYFTLSLSMTLVNQTTGRAIAFKSVDGVTAPLSNPTFFLSAVWDTGNPVCIASSITTAPCAMMLGFGYDPNSLDPSGTVTLETYKGQPAGAFTAGLAAFSESSWPTVQAALKSPSHFLISYSGGDTDRFTCALNDQLGVALAESPGASTCSYAAVQLVQQPTPKS